MTSTTKIRAVLFIVLMCLPSIAAAQKEKPSGQSIITGRVVFADTGQPVRRATLKLYTNMRLGPARTTAANIRGEFRFSEVAAGSYFVVAEAAGVLFPRSAYAINEFGIGSDTEMEHTQVTVDGKNSIRCEVRVLRAGTIRGTITYADKEPVLGGRIVLFRRKGGVVVPFFAAEASTNDRGMYRIDGLPDGEYFVGVAAGRLGSPKTRISQDEVGIPTAYYPGVTDTSEAKPIEIQSGSEVAGINITLNENPLREMSGVVKWRSSGKAAEPVALILRRKDEPRVDLSLGTLYESMGREQEGEGSVIKDTTFVSRSFPPFLMVEKNGEWKFTDLPPGTYVVTAFGAPPKKEKGQTGDGEVVGDSGSARRLDPDRVVFQQVEVTIEDEDLKDVTIELPVGNRILGTVSVEGAEAIKASIMVDQEGGNELLLSVPHFNNPDGTFLLDGIPTGKVILDADVSGFPDFYLKSITLGGQDLLREPLVVTEGAEVTGVRIDIGKGLALLTGRVQFKDDAEPAAGGGVLLVKADSKLWHLRSSRRFAMTNAAGEFKLRCAPGEYLVFTWPAGAQPFQTIAEFVRLHASSARTITLQSKEEKKIELTVSAPRK
jgi:hypothetical protein